MTRKTMTDSEFEEYFDAGGDVTGFMVEGTIHHPGRDTTPRPLSINPPSWIVEVLDAEASRMGISRKAVINVWLSERADQVILNHSFA